MIQLRGIGQCSLIVGNMRLTPASETLFALTVFLAVEAGREIPRAELVELIWPCSGEERSSHRLRQLVYRLNLAGAGLRCDRGTIELPREHVDTDLARLKPRLDDANLDRLLEELDGTFLPGFEPRISEAYNHWLERQRDLVARSLTRALSTALVSKKAQGAWRDAEALAIRCLRFDPLNEEATLVLAEAAAAAGSKSRALDILTRYLNELGPGAGEFARPATVLRQRISEWPTPPRHDVTQVPCVGREEELAELYRLLSMTHRRPGRAVVLSGEQGIGKSRLISELVARATVRNFAVTSHTCEPHDRRRVLAAVTDLTSVLLDTPGALGSSPESLSELRRLVSQQISISESTEDAELVSSLIRRAFLDLLDSICSEGPLVMIIEDAQWTDATSQHFLLRIARELLTRRILLVLTTRDRRTAAELFAAMPRSPTHIRLDPLQTDASTALVRHVLAQIGRAESPGFVDWCVAYAGGNPLYLMQLAALATTNKGRFSPPASLRSLLTDRLAQLGGIARGLLRACCVLGRQATFERLESLLGERRAAFIAAIDELERAGFVVTHASGISYRHELLARVVLDDLAPAARRRLHRHAAEVLDGERCTPRTAPILWDSARHWEEAGEPSQAVEKLRSCASLSVSLGAPGEAAAVLAHAHRLCKDPVDRVAILQHRAVALQLADRWEEVAAIVAQIKRSPLGSPAPLAIQMEVELLQLEAGWHTGRPFAGLLPAALRCAREPGLDQRHRLRAAALALVLADNLCSPQDVHEIYESLAYEVPTSEAVWRAWHYLRMVYHAAFGVLGEVPSAARDLLNAAAENGNPAALSRCLRHASIALSIAGSLSEAIESAEHAFEIATSSELTNAAAASATTLASLHLRLDRTDEAQRWHQRAIRGGATSTSPMARTVQLGVGARLAIEAGDYPNARSLIAEIQRIVANAGSVRADVELAALRSELALKEEHRGLSSSELNHLERLHLRARAFSGHDYFVRVLVDSLRERGLAERAGDLAGEYLSRYRREATEPPSSLLTALAAAQNRVAERPSSLRSSTKEHNVRQTT